MKWVDQTRGVNGNSCWPPPAAKPGSRLRRLGSLPRRTWAACFGASVEQQLWTWFLPNPIERRKARSSTEKDSCKT